MQSPHPNTKARILAAAEQEFGLHGFEAASLRQITALAGANLAAANYHFGSKEELYCEVFLNRIRPINQSRLDLLERAVAGHLPSQVPLAEIMDAFIRPIFESLRNDNSGHLLRILARNFQSQLPFVRAMMAQEFDPVAKRFIQELRPSLPGRTAEDVLWGLLLSSGSLLFVASRHGDLESISHGLCSTADLEDTIARIVRFISAGIAAQ